MSNRIKKLNQDLLDSAHVFARGVTVELLENFANSIEAMASSKPECRAKLVAEILRFAATSVQETSHAYSVAAGLDYSELALKPIFHAALKSLGAQPNACS